jgi:hypothetical protein
MVKDKKKKPVVSVYKQGKRIFMIYTLPDGSRMSFETKFKGK